MFLKIKKKKETFNTLNLHSKAVMSHDFYTHKYFISPFFFTKKKKKKQVQFSIHDTHTTFIKQEKKIIYQRNHLQLL